MKTLRLIISLICTGLVLAGCAANTINLQTIARKRASLKMCCKENVCVEYHITDLDVLDYTDQVKASLARKGNIDSGVQYGATSTQVTLGALAGASTAFGWAASTASTLGIAGTYVFGLGQVFNAKDRSQAYETALSDIQKSESTYFFFRTGNHFEAVNGKVVPKYVLKDDQGGDVPPHDRLTKDGQTLYYRVTKAIAVLEAALANKIPNLQDLKDAKGDTSSAPSPPVASIAGSN